MVANNDEPGLHRGQDIRLEKLAPHAPVCRQRHTVGHDNADDHMKRQVKGRKAVVAISGGRLDFGTWERVLYGVRKVRRSAAQAGLVKIIGE